MDYKVCLLIARLNVLFYFPRKKITDRKYRDQEFFNSICDKKHPSSIRIKYTKSVQKPSHDKPGVIHIRLQGQTLIYSL